VPKHQREFRGFDDKILSMYALGLTTRQIQDHLKDIYAIEVSPELISRGALSEKMPDSVIPLSGFNKKKRTIAVLSLLPFFFPAISVRFFPQTQYGRRYG
jgi:hypothetical protein